MRKVKLFAGIPFVYEKEYSMNDLGLNEDATEEEIKKALYEIIINNLDWGWEELKN